jgi:fumarate reductase flavoprotein subunit
MAWSALERQESRGAHKRLDQFGERDDERFLQHTLAFHQADGPPRLEYQPVTITRLPPAERVYGGAAKQAAAAARGAER